MTSTPNLTAEQVRELVANLVPLDLIHDRGRPGQPQDAFEAADRILDALREHGLLSEGTPSEEQARAIRKLDNVQAILAGAQASITDAVRELSLTSAALVAAQGAAPQAHYSEPVMSAPQVESEDNVMCRCGHGTGSHDFSDPQEPCREIVCDCRGWFGVSPVLPSSGVDVETLANLIHSTSVAHFGGLDPRVAPIIARAVAGWLKGQER